MEFDRPPQIAEAVVLMAGSGSRLRVSGHAIPKPLVPVLGRPLIGYVIDNLARAGVRVLHAVVGWKSERLLAGLEPLVPDGMRLHPIFNQAWEKQNGVSLLAAEAEVTAPFLLTMADHLFDFALLATLIRQADPGQLNLAIDRKIDSIFDLEDAMKVQVRDDRVTAIAKDLAIYDAIDTGVFCCPIELLHYLHRAQRDGDCSLADGVRLMAAEGKVRAIDIGDAWWQDVDTFAMRKRAEEELSKRQMLRPEAPSVRSSRPAAPGSASCRAD
jgi:1L-myo-inositol 1-phosphate cytidylyltransferase